MRLTHPISQLAGTPRQNSLAPLPRLPPQKHFLKSSPDDQHSENAFARLLRRRVFVHFSLLNISVKSDPTTERNFLSRLLFSYPQKIKAS